jgi:hypothetical protein
MFPRRRHGAATLRAAPRHAEAPGLAVIRPLLLTFDFWEPPESGLRVPAPGHHARKPASASLTPISGAGGVFRNPGLPIFHFFAGERIARA